LQTIQRAIIVFRDITERKNLEDRLKTYMEKLERSNRDLRDFASIASHDMKEPLRKIVGPVTSALRIKASGLMNSISTGFLHPSRGCMGEVGTKEPEWALPSAKRLSSGMAGISPQRVLPGRVPLS